MKLGHNFPLKCLLPNKILKKQLNI